MKKRGYFGNSGLANFISNFGGVKSSITIRQNRRGTKGSRGLQISKPVEIPIISPALYSYQFAGNTAYLNMEELNYTMPPYSEEVIPVEKEPFRKPLRDLIEIDDSIKAFFKAMDKSTYHLKASFLKLLLYAEDNMTISYQLSMSIDEKTKQMAKAFLGDECITEDDRLIIGNIPPQMGKDELSNKEKALIAKIRQEFAQGRRCMIYTYFTHKTKITDRLMEVLQREFPNKKFGILPDKLKAERIESFLEDNYFDCCMAPYKRVATGMDIVMYPTLIFYQFGYEITGIRQARRRAWRAVKQKNDCHVFFVAYDGPQATTLELLTKKIAAASVAEGEIVKKNDIAALSMSSLEVELLNRIVDNAEDIVSREYKTEHIPKGKLRAWTKWEKYYLDLLKDINPLTIEHIDPEMFNKLGIKKDEVETEIAEIVEDVEVKEEEEKEEQSSFDDNVEDVELDFAEDRNEKRFYFGKKHKSQSSRKSDFPDFSKNNKIFIVKRKGKRVEVYENQILESDKVLYTQNTLF